MKYFALLTKLGENLLAQATALGTKLELTHMAVGDGGGSLPTPDTNQTKLIKEQRRAAINTLFIDEQNKNQIVAEQIIPEKDGGWWIREIGLFDKDGNLIAVANCPETYKPQLAEGSGRTQSIRMVLIVSHTESVTLKIDPSVVLATREYVNTEITVLDKKIDALSAQTKLDLNKKFDKANISDVKGNDTAKVPSLHLFTGEIGKLQPKGDYVLVGYSYSKTESDGKYQPKGNYAPAGDYATNTALKDGLNGKFDKKGGRIDGSIDTYGNISSLTGKAIVKIETAGEKTIISSSIGNGFKIHQLQDSSGTLMHHGDYGWAGVGYALSSLDAQQYPSFLKSKSTISRIYRVDIPDGEEQFQYSAVAYFRSSDTFTAVTASYKGLGVKILAGNEKEYFVYNLWSDRNTTTDRNGHIKVSGINDLSDYPVGSPIPWPQSTPPVGYLICNGQSFNKASYPLLAKAYPSGILPDLRGEFIRGLDAGRNVDGGRTILSTQGDATRNITGEFSADALTDQVRDPVINGAFYLTNKTYRTAQRHESNTTGGLGLDISRVVPTANEFRPRNIAYLYIVRAA
ncbi:phage tail-collar fiber domain-containing protein [Providencia huaxiensis]|uniref:phage tail-collar fiber domain-containing protein n=1 Tax=Providencia huaxiensis TaxID=2027290 RepID=UPI0024AB7CEB|nr:phage tail protein [Providencia rettgeri]